jgi:hypothetical protein
MSTAVATSSATCTICARRGIVSGLWYPSRAAAKAMGGSARPRSYALCKAHMKLSLHAVEQHLIDQAKRRASH